LNEFNYLPEAISHKQLNSLLTAAQKETLRDQDQINLFSDEYESFKRLLESWSSLSQKLLDELEKKNSYLVEGRKPQTLMALGALGSHLKIALQAQKASDLP